MKRFRRIICIVLDGVGIGEAPDAASFGDTGSNSLCNTARAVGGLRLPNLGRLGLANIRDIDGVTPAAVPAAFFGKLTPRAAGKDSTSGHWELMGCALDEPMPTYPEGFPGDVIEAFETATGRVVLGNVAASGTEIIRELGERQVETGGLIVYTSQDSVFQIAAHEEVVPVDELYRCCEIARGLLVSPHNVGRVIARPFAGKPGGFHRTERRKDFSVEPPAPTVLDALIEAGKRVLAVGKIFDLFAGRGITAAIHTPNNAEGMRLTLREVAGPPPGRDRGEAGLDYDFIFTNLVDFDTMWGHRNDARAYALGLEEFDSFLNDLLPALRGDDLLIITSDHGNDPTTPSTDHSREYVPILVYHRGLAGGKDLGTRGSLMDVGRTVAENFGVGGAVSGRGFLEEL